MSGAAIQLRDGRTIGYAEFGDPQGTPVLWCHGGPGSRLESSTLGPAAAELGLRLVGIDRPGYGKSTPMPGRTIAAWVPDALAVADRLGLARFAAVGVSTGGSYSLALAALAPERSLGVVACCALTDMRWAEGKAAMSGGGIQELWAARDRVTALAIATEWMGADGSKMFAQAGPQLAPSDMALLADPEWIAAMPKAMAEMFAFGVQGYVDDRLADGLGWETFDVSRVTCPVTVLHGDSDLIVPVAQAHHTAQLVPGAKPRVCPELGHFSIMSQVLPELAVLLRR
jgi:pimeloyl-ACP methyl ester carboxylesterase